MPAPAPSPPTGRRVWWLLLAAAAVVTLLIAPIASRLTVKTDLTEMLPKDSPASTAYLSSLRDFGAIERVFIVVAGDSALDSDAVLQAAEDLAAGLAQSGLVADARTGLTDDDAAFLLRQVVPRLILSRTPDATTLEHFAPDAIDRRLASLRAQLALPFAPAWQARLLAADPFGLLSEPDSVTSDPIAASVDPTSGSFLAADGSAALVVATAKDEELDAASGAALQLELDRLFAETGVETKADLEFFAVGGPLYAAAEQLSVRRDLITTVLTSALAVVLILFLYFGRFLVPAILAVSVFAGLIWAAVVPVTLYGGLSIFAVSFGSILVGLGVDYGIHGAVAFGRRRARGDSPTGGMAAAGREVLPAIGSSVATTAVGFLILTRASFAPLGELGVIVGLGIALMAIAFAVIGAPLLVLIPSGPPRGPAPVATTRVVQAVGAAAARRPRLTIGTILVVTVVALWGWPRLTASSNLASMRPDERPLHEAETQLAKRFGIDTETMVVSVAAPGLDRALDGATTITALLRDELPHAAVTSPSDWLLGGRTIGDRVRDWEPHRDLLRSAVDEFRSRLNDFGFAPQAFAPGLAIIDHVASGQTPAPIPETAWPTWLAEMVHRDQEGASVAVHVRASRGSLSVADKARLETALRDRVPGASIAAVDLVGAEIRNAVARDFDHLGRWCALAVLTVLLLSFRGRFGATMLTLLPVTGACIWLLGFSALFGIEMTPFAVMVLPVVIGIGVDDGLHVVHSRKARGDFESAVATVGPAIALTTATTCVAFGSLTLSKIPALRQGGVMVAVGTAMCLLLTLTLLPAIEALRRTSK